MASVKVTNNNPSLQLPNSFNDKIEQSSLANLDRKSANSMQKYLNFDNNVAYSVSMVK